MFSVIFFYIYAAHRSEIIRIISSPRATVLPDRLSQLGLPQEKLRQTVPGN